MKPFNSATVLAFTKVFSKFLWNKILFCRKHSKNHAKNNFFMFRIRRELLYSCLNTSSFLHERKNTRGALRRHRRRIRMKPVKRVCGGVKTRGYLYIVTFWYVVSLHILSCVVPYLVYYNVVNGIIGTLSEKRFSEDN